MTDIRIEDIVTVVFFAYIGAFYHWFMMKKDKRAQGTFWDYLVADYPGRSIATGAAIIFTSWMSVTSGASVLIHPDILWIKLSNGLIDVASVNGIVSAIAIGYMLDSGINKGGA